MTRRQDPIARAAQPATQRFAFEEFISWESTSSRSRATALILRTVMYFNPLKVFVPLALLIGLGLGGSLYYDCFVITPANLSDKTVILFLAFLHVLAVGTLADLVEKRSRL